MVFGCVKGWNRKNFNLGILVDLLRFFTNFRVLVGLKMVSGRGFEGYQLSVISYQLSAISYQQQDITTTQHHYNRAAIQSSVYELMRCSVIVLL